MTAIKLFLWAIGRGALDGWRAVGCTIVGILTFRGQAWIRREIQSIDDERHRRIEELVRRQMRREAEDQ